MIMSGESVIVVTYCKLFLKTYTHKKMLKYRKLVNKKNSRVIDISIFTSRPKDNCIYSKITLITVNTINHITD